MNRAQFVNQVFKKLEDKHIYLYHDISKEEFEKHKQKFLKNVDKLDETHFEGGMLKLFALFKDAHTMYQGVRLNYVNAIISLIGKDFYIKKDDCFKKLSQVNGYKIENVVEKLKELIPYEVETWAYSEARRLLQSPKAMEMIGCGSNKDEICFGCDDGENVVATLPTSKELGKYPKKPFYESKKFDNDEILYIRYRLCQNMQDYPFSKFVEDVVKSCKKLPKACLVDVRYNTGGNSKIIVPLINWLKENKIKSYMLMNETVFSSGIFALWYFKKHLNATLIGTEAGQPTRNYGECGLEEVEGKKFTYCKKYFELTSCHDENAPVKYSGGNDLECFDYVGVVKPDIKVENTVEDLNNGTDSQLEEGLKIIKNEIIKQNNKNSLTLEY